MENNKTEAAKGGKKQLNHLNDILVKFIFFHKDRKHLTISLINSVFEKEGMPLIVDFTFQDRELDPTDWQDKESRVDILGVCSDGTTIEIEFQLAYFYPMGPRSVLYWSRLFGLQMLKGGKYEDLKRTVCINILAHSIFDDADTSDYYNAFAIINKHHAKHILTDLFEMYFIELPKWERVRKSEKMSQLSYWLAYFSSKTKPEELEKLAMSNPAIREAMEAEKLFMRNPNLVTAYEQAEKTRMDRIAEQRYWEVKLEQAAEQAADKKALSIARKLIATNMPVEQIASITDLPIETVKTIRPEA
ncbi:MAG: Rpn family recombination-promoting nuclease/putative transposase [Desulfovibrionaceae bacterium]|nr:Rpn family recombination-promoting nuclease/putative transposase [Desulfovibrionaceae bacterium]